MMYESSKLHAELLGLAPDLVRCNVLLSTLSYWKIGGSADYVIEPKSIQQLADIRKLLSHYSTVPVLYIGDGSNLLFDDEGFRGVIVKIGNNLSKVNFEDTHVSCESGVWVPGLAYQSYRKGLSGLEHTCGIPGRLGGFIYMNGGSDRKAISDVLIDVTLIDKEGNISIVKSKEFDFSYRVSPFQSGDNIIAAATLKLEASNISDVRSKMRTTLSTRRKKFPRKLPNCGSVFVSNPNMYNLIGPPGFAIEKAGLKGIKIGNAQVSLLHANFIVNTGGASSSDVLRLIHLIRVKVFEQTGFWMESEVRYVSPSGDICQAHIKTTALWALNV